MACCMSSLQQDKRASHTTAGSEAHNWCSRRASKPQQICPNHPLTLAIAALLPVASAWAIDWARAEPEVALDLASAMAVAEPEPGAHLGAGGEGAGGVGLGGELVAAAGKARE